MLKIKVCVRCGSTDQYRTGQCRPCMKAYHEHKEKQAQYYVRNRDKTRVYQAVYYRANATKIKARTVAWRKAHPGYRLLQDRQLTLIQWAELLIKQSGRCWLCDRPMYCNPVVDHDHATNVVRGLAHTQYNAAFGLLKEDPVVLRALAKKASSLKQKRRPNDD